MPGWQVFKVLLRGGCFKWGDDHSARRCVFVQGVKTQGEAGDVARNAIYWWFSVGGGWRRRRELLFSCSCSVMMITISGALKIGILAGTRRCLGRCRRSTATPPLKSWSFAIACANECHRQDAIAPSLMGSARRALNARIILLFHRPCPAQLRIFTHPFLQVIMVLPLLPDWVLLCLSRFWPLGLVWPVLCA
jgi:hypothetical protein